MTESPQISGRGRVSAHSRDVCNAFPWGPTSPAPHELEATSLEIQSLFSTSLLAVCSSRLLVAGFLPLKRVKHKLSWRERLHTNPLWPPLKKIADNNAPVTSDKGRHVKVHWGSFWSIKQAKQAGTDVQGTDRVTLLMQNVAMCTIQSPTEVGRYVKCKWSQLSWTHVVISSIRSRVSQGVEPRPILSWDWAFRGCPFHTWSWHNQPLPMNLFSRGMF